MPSGGRRENFWGISCEKSRFNAKKSYIFQFYGGGGRTGCAPPPWIRPCHQTLPKASPNSETPTSKRQRKACKACSWVLLSWYQKKPNLFTVRLWFFAQALEVRTPLFPQLVPPAIMVWILVWKYIFEPFIHMLQHFMLQLTRSNNFCF